jgi:tetratricopeptide (TPR) repeat protein
MKLKNISLFLLAGLFSCSSKKNEAPARYIPATSVETQLKNDIARFPDSLLLKESLIQLYRDSGKYELALEAVNSEIAKDSSNPKLWDMKAVLHFEEGDTTGSILAFEKALGIASNPADIVSLGILYAQTKNPKALQLADQLLTRYLSFGEKQAFFIKGLYHSFTGEKVKSIDFFDRCISIDFTYMDAYREKAIALYDLAKYNEAVEVLKKATTLQNSFDEGYYYLGKCFEKLNNKQEAIDAYRKALMYSPDYTEAKEALQGLGEK